MINLQWFDTDIIVVNKHSKTKNLLSLLKQIKNNHKTIKTAVIYKSSGHLLLNLLLEKYDIPKEKLDITFYKGGNEVRQALIRNNLDFIVVPSQGSETYRANIRVWCTCNLFIWNGAKRFDLCTENYIKKHIVCL